MGRYRGCIIFLADGARPDVMEQMLAEGELPNMQRYIIEKGSYRRAITVFPSATGPTHLPFLTGCYPGTCNIPGIRWFDREEFYQKTVSTSRFRTYVGLGDWLINRDLNKQVQTLFQIFEKPVNIFSSISRGVGLLSNGISIPKTPYWFLARITGCWPLVDRAAAKHLVSVLRRKNPDFIFVLFPAIDVMTHFSEPFSEKVLNLYREIDVVVGKIVSQLKRTGNLEDTLLILTSDHGLTPTHTHFDLVEFMERRGMKVLYHPKILRTHFSAAVMVSGNAMAHLYVKNSNGWRRRTYYQELRSNGMDLISELVQQPEIDFVASKDDEGSIYVTCRSGEAVIREENGIIHYTSEGEDPFGYADIPNALTYEGSLEITFDSEYPDALVQLIQIFRSERTGDIILTSKKGFDLRDKFETPKHRSSHGSLHREHMQVPLLINHEIKRKWIRTANIFPSILELTGKKYDGKIDGESFV